MWDLLNASGDPLPGIVCYKDLPSLSSDSAHFTFDVPGSIYMPTIGGNNQSNFFGNVHARRAFASSLNFTEILEAAWFNEAISPATWHIENLAPNYIDPTVEHWDYDPAEIEAELKLANYTGPLPANSLWELGFHVTILWNTGNDQRKIVCDMMKQNIEALNALRPTKPPFIVDSVGIPWADILDLMEASHAPMFQIGWLADFADVDNWARPYMHTYGDFSYLQGYSNSTVDELIDLGIKTPNSPARQAIYYDLQHTFINECPTIMIVQPLGRGWMRNWVQGWYYNPLHFGPVIRDRWKGFFIGDLNRDMVVDIFDLVIVASEFGKPPPPIADPRADVNGDGVVDIFDIVLIAADFGKG